MNKKATCGVIILAAGLGKRMCSPLPKVLHPIGGKPLLFHVLSQVFSAIPNARVAIVVGHGKEKVEASIRGEPQFHNHSIDFIVQPEQRGTGDAVRCAVESLWGQSVITQGGAILILPGDVPLITSELIQQMTLPLKPAAALRLLSCTLSNPTGYGRVVRHKEGSPILRIVEEKDSSHQEKAVQEVAVSIYLFQSHFLAQKLSLLSNQNAQGEYYLTDLVEHASRSQLEIDSLVWKNDEELQGVNDLWELSQANHKLNQRCLMRWAKKGVYFMDIQGTWVDVTVEFEPGVTVSSGAILRGKTKIGEGSVIGAGVCLQDMEIGRDVHLKAGTVAECSIVREGAQIGPYAHLRPYSVIEKFAKVGNFVELKSSRLGEGSKISHLSYLGDAEVGNNVNIGCGFVTCNYDGRTIDGERKHRTIIEDGVFLGSDCQTVAPVRIGKGAYVASGSTITEDVPAESLAIARSRQINKPDYARKLKEK